MTPEDPRWEWLRGMISRRLLPAWFLIFAAVHVLDLAWTDRIGIDARIYHRGAATWIQGGDPWASAITLRSGDPYHFAGLPPTVLIFAPATLVPEAVFGLLFVLLSAAAAVWMILYRLRLPWWWLLFPPLVQGVLLGNPGVVLLALLLLGHPVAEAAAAAIKIYALVPLIARLRLKAIAIFAVASAVSVVVFPGLWLTYQHVGGEAAGRLLDETAGGTGATHSLPLLLLTILAIGCIAWLQRDAAGWLAVPSLWPSAQFHYPIMALPVMTIPMAFILAPPTFGLPAMAVVLHAWTLLWKRYKARGGFQPQGHTPDPVQRQPFDKSRGI